MNIFTEKNSFVGKVNFIDDNNVCVGYDLSQSCCEHADWYISEDKEVDRDKSNILTDVEGYNFDIDFFEELGLDEDQDSVCYIIRFRLMKQGNKDLYLHLYNVQNGYYSHGFTMTKGDKIIHDGSI